MTEARQKALALLGAEDTGQSSKELADQIRFLIDGDQVFINDAMIKDGQLDLPIHRVYGDEPRQTLHRIPNDLTLAEGRAVDIVVKVDMSGMAQSVDNVERLTKAIQQAVMERIGTSTLLDGMRGPHAKAVAVDTALGIALAGVGAGLDLGKEYLAIQQLGGDVQLARLGGKPLTAEDFRAKPGNNPHKFAGGFGLEPLPFIDEERAKTKEFFDTQVVTSLKPQVACALSFAAPITRNGKAPVNILPRGVDDVK